MSHVTCSLAVITDLDCLKRTLAAKFPALQWMEGQQKYNWYGSWQNDFSTDQAAYKRGVDVDQYGKCEHAIRVPGCAYEIGVTKRKDGEGYTLVWDLWRGKEISKAIGQDAEILMNAYNEEYVSSYAQANGYMLQEEVNSDGNLVMTLLQ